MKPDAEKLLETFAVHLMVKTGPALEHAYDRSTVGTIAAMLLAIREEFERAASRRVEENAAMRAIFREASSVVEDAGLQRRLESAAASGDPGLEVSVLEATNAELRALLIDLHAHIETLSTDSAERIDAAIWQELAHSTERRRLSLGTF